MKLLGAVAAIVLLFTSCASKNDATSSPSPSSAEPTAQPATSINVKLLEWSIEASSLIGKAGKITFAVKDTGKLAHEFVIFKTDLSPFSLPTKPDGSVDEEKLNDVGEGGDLTVGGSKTSTFDLPAGKYVFVCNRVDKKTNGKSNVHYQLGMREAFTVQ